MNDSKCFRNSLLEDWTFKKEHNLYFMNNNFCDIKLIYGEAIKKNSKNEKIVNSRKNIYIYMCIYVYIMYVDFFASFVQSDNSKSDPSSNSKT